MDGAFRFTPREEQIIKRMYDDRLPARQIAKIMDKPPLEVSAFIKTRLMKRAKPPTVIGGSKPPVTVKRERLNHTPGPRHYNDPLAAIEGSRKLLEAIHTYLAKCRDTAT